MVKLAGCLLDKCQGASFSLWGPFCMAADFYLTCTGLHPRRASTVSLCSVLPLVQRLLWSNPLLNGYTEVGATLGSGISYL